MLLCSAAPAQTSDAPPRDAELERVVFQAFPEADGYKCITRNVDLADRRRVEQRLTFKIYFDELGEHCLTVAFRGRRPVGLIYRRKEEADWGLTEIAWHITLDLRVVGFQFIRGRNRHIRALEQSRFAASLANADLGKVLARVAEHERGEHAERNKEITSLERTTLRSAAKALIVTEVVWEREIEKLHDQAIGFDLFPAAARFTRRTTTLDMLHGGAGQTVEVKVLYAYDLGNTLLGCVAWSEARDGEQVTALRWVIDRDMRVTDVVPTHNVRDLALRKQCSVIKGHALADPPEQAAALSPLARTLGATVPALMQHRSPR